MDPKAESTATPDAAAAAAASFPTGDGSLMELYESRLKRLREYETRVYSRYSAPSPFASSSGDRKTPLQQQIEVQQRVKSRRRKSQKTNSSRTTTATR